MQPILTLAAYAPARVVSNRRLLIGRLVTAVPALFLTVDGVTKLARIGPVVDAFARMGIPDHLARGIGALALACLALYLIPRTAVLGAVLLTGFLGGAVALHLRLGDPLLSHTLFPIYLGAFVWTGLYLRDARVRALLTAPRESDHSAIAAASAR